MPIPVASPVRLLVGLGNPGSKFAVTRHNAGFWFVDAVARRYRADLRKNARFFGETTEITAGRTTLRVLKPATYMNESGRAVAAVVGFYRLPIETVLIAHDEIDLPPGAVRLKRGGGHGGHNGLRDIIPALSSPDFARLRIGVGHPGDKDAVTDYVLSRANAEEKARIDEAIDRALAQFERIVAGDMQRAMNELHRKSDEAGDPA